MRSSCSFPFDSSITAQIAMTRSIYSIALAILAAAAAWQTSDAVIAGCPSICTMLYAPVCASNGVTYGNTCMMQAAACRAGKKFEIVNNGPCSKNSGPVRNIRQKTPVAGLKQCNIMCTMDYRPVCASDGNTYGNECTMKSAACEMGETLTVVSRGECGAEVPQLPSRDPTTTTTSAPTTMKAAPEREKCVSFCPMIYFPICGTDGKTYGNECEMKYVSCASGKVIKGAYQGECVTKANNCQAACYSAVEPVCASDGKTYASECAMRVSACQTDAELSVISRGEC